MVRRLGPWALATVVALSACGEDVTFLVRPGDAGTRPNVGLDVAAGVGTLGDAMAVDATVLEGSPG
ncbi:MAG TPA: hypothetical protein VKU41_16235, partial [Polyangiaceae bacterium]|nr:hypothetical protein [Polyangiaceae bacterium]